MVVNDKAPLADAQAILAATITGFVDVVASCDIRRLHSGIARTDLCVALSARFRPRRARVGLR